MAEQRLEIRVDMTDIDRLVREVGIDRIRRPVEQAINDMGNAVLRQAQSNAPVGLSGGAGLRGSIGMQVLPGRPFPEGIRFGTRLKYGEYVEFGTGLFGPRRQRIYPRRAKALAWPSSQGDTILTEGANAGERGFIRRSIRGMKARPYLRPAIQGAATPLRVIRARLTAEIARLLLRRR